MAHTNNKYQYRFLARIVIEAQTPLAVSSGEKDIMTDKLVARDVNGLPYIPGTAIAGILRHAIGEEIAKTFFGHGGEKKNGGQGSEIIFSSAQMVDETGEVVEGLIGEKSNYLKNFDELPVRQHVRMSDKGTAVEHGKFDEEVVYKGTRFCFEIELLSKTDNSSNFDNVLKNLAKDTIRIGGGTRKGFGEISIVECKKAVLNLETAEERNAYIEKSSSLNAKFWKDKQVEPHGNTQNNEWTTYQLKLQPDDFFLFGSGFGNDKADMTAVTEKYIDWLTGSPKIKTNNVLIPGSSVKGALSHRVAFHYNRLLSRFVETNGAKTGVENEAVQALFGYTRKVKDENGKETEELQRGNVLISDVIQAKKSEKEKVLNHVSIDRFTGGAIDSALFAEEVTYGKGEIYTLTFKVNNKVLTGKVKDAFEAALSDIKTGMLPLGGGTNRGHGCFSEYIDGNDKLLKHEEHGKQ